MSLNIFYRYLNFKTLSLFLFYACVSAFSYSIAYQLRFDFNVPENHALDCIQTIWWVTGLQLSLLMSAGQFDSILSYFRLPDALRLFTGLFANTLILLSMWYVYSGQNVPPRAVILTYFLLSFLFIASFRIFMRIKSSRSWADWLTPDTYENIIIIGAGEVGAGLCNELINKSHLAMRPVAFLDDDTKKVGQFVHGVKVAGTINELSTVAKRYGALRVVIAFPSAPIKRIRIVSDIARNANLAVDTVPALTDLVSGRAELSQIRPIQLEDLLGRDAVDLDSKEIRNLLQDKRVLVTGAGGSIGRELVTQILDYSPCELTCVDQAEIAIFNLKQDVLNNSRNQKTKVISQVLDIQDRTAIEGLFSQCSPEVVFHAAAHKHVTLMECQPGEALRNNFLATEQLAEISIQNNVEKFIFISTDKAINPTSVMGASKRLAELALHAQHSKKENQTKFIAVRFGNVLGSSGSVIPIFRKQISEGGPVTVTDPEVNRFFMTADEAVGLVLQSATQGVGDEIFVLNMGKSVKIIDLARQLIELSGLREGIDIDIIFTGLKPGEKLFEEVQHLSESLQETSHPRVMRLVSGHNKELDFDLLKKEITSAINSPNPIIIKRIIQKYLTEYTFSDT